MKALETRALRGASPWGREVVLLRLDAEALDGTSGADAVARLLAALPGLRAHEAFAQRAADGAWAAHAVAHVAVELQRVAGFAVGEGSARGTRTPGHYVVTYPYVDESAGVQAGADAVQLVGAAAQRSVDAAPLVANLRRLATEHGLGPSTGSVVDEARRRGIPTLRLDEGDHVQLGHGARQRRIQGTLTDRTSGVGMLLADDKERTKAILRAAGVPVPRGDSVRTLGGAFDAADWLGFPVVVKPLVGNHGRGITTGIRSLEEVEAAFERAREVHPRVIVERHLDGHDHRLLVIGNRFVAAARRDPPQVVGDGASTVRDLVERLNADPRRGEAHENVLTRVTLDEDALALLAKQGLSPGAVPEAGRRVLLKSTPNLSAGGTATDVTDEVHPSIRAMAERVSRIIDLDVCGIDVVASTLQRPLAETGGGVVEVNAAPGLRMHLAPTHGEPRNVAAPLVDMLFPHDDGRIPLVAVTGTNGKTTTVRLIAHVLKQRGLRVGMANTSGVEVDERVVVEGDYAGPGGAAAVLREPTVDAAVLEVARGGILRRGLGFDASDVGVLLNVACDHLGEEGVETIDDLARVKGVVLEAVKPEGTAVMNADDPVVMGILPRVRARVTLFSLDPEGTVLREHVARGGTGVTVRDGHVMVLHGRGAFPIVPVRDVPVTLDGRARFNVQNVLAATAACHALGVPEEAIGAALATFNPTIAQLPGRMNVLDLGRVRVLIDYGHNVAAVEALADVLDHLGRGRRIVVANSSGNRRDEDIRAFGAAMAKLYHHVILTDPDPRQRPPGEAPDLLRDGLRAAGFPDENLQIVLDEGEGIEVALDMAQPGDLVVLQADGVKDAIARVRARQALLPPVAKGALPPAPATTDATAT